MEPGRNEFEDVLRMANEASKQGYGVVNGGGNWGGRGIGKSRHDLGSYDSGQPHHQYTKITRTKRNINEDLPVYCQKHTKIPRNKHNIGGIPVPAAVWNREKSYRESLKTKYQLKDKVREFEREKFSISTH